MAATSAGRQLTEAHRLAQARLGAATAAQVASLWPLLDLGALDATFDRWLAAVVPVVRGARQASAQLAATYYQTFRGIEAGLTDPFTATVAGDLDLDRLTAGLLVTGPGSIKAAMTRGDRLVEAARTARAASSAVGQYHTLTGGRDTIAGTVAADRRALGWARTTSGRCCAFCAMLAGRGFVYSESTVDFRAHPGCSCGAEPTFTRDSMLPPGSDDFRQLYNDATRDLPRGADPLAAFRRSLEQSRAA